MTGSGEQQTKAQRLRAGAREAGVLTCVAAILVVGLLFAVNSYGLSCDNLGEPPSFLCRHPRTRLLTYLVLYLGIALIVARRIHPIARQVAPWSALPLFVMLWAIFEWGQRGGEIPRGGGLGLWATYFGVALLSVAVCRRRRSP